MILTIIAIYAAGYLLSYAMLRIEHEAEQRPYTHGDRLLNLSVSLGSLVTVAAVLVITWVKHIGQLGYWARPVGPEPKKKEDAK
ncbi:MAG TPA: hypothetical protein VGN00_14240 [Puia sp.]